MEVRQSGKITLRQDYDLYPLPVRSLKDASTYVYTFKNFKLFCNPRFCIYAPSFDTYAGILANQHPDNRKPV
jgi:hypothetical protein